VRGETVPQRVAGGPLVQTQAIDGLRDRPANGRFVDVMAAQLVAARIARRLTRGKDKLPAELAAAVGSSRRQSVTEFFRVRNHPAEHSANFLVASCQRSRLSSIDVAAIAAVIDPNRCLRALAVRIGQLAYEGIGVLPLTLSLGNVGRDATRRAPTLIGQGEALLNRETLGLFKDPHGKSVSQLKHREILEAS
jgi:hypothetical protein